MKLLFKALISICALGAGGLLGIYLLDWSVPWKYTLFLLACWGMGHLIYALFRTIDKRFAR